MATKTVTLLGKRRKLKLIAPSAGDLLVFPHEGKYLIGIVVSHSVFGTWVKWKRQKKIVEYGAGFLAPQALLHDSAWKLVGRKFASVDEAYREMVRHKKVKA